MRSYGITKSRFWNGPTGRQIRAAGSDTQLVALYLFTGPHVNAIGLYYLPFELLLKHLALPGNRIRHALLDLDHLHFAHYDCGASDVVWVREMAHHQLGALKEGDGRVKAASRLYVELPPNPYLGSFFDRYAVELRLETGRRDIPDRGVPPGGGHPPPDPDPDPDPDFVVCEVPKRYEEQSAGARAIEGGTPPLDLWLRQLQAAYPPQRVTYGHLTEHAFVDVITKDARASREVFDDMLAHLDNQKRGYEWRVKRMVPKLERWLREGLCWQIHDAHPPTAVISERTVTSAIAADAFVEGGEKHGSR